MPKKQPHVPEMRSEPQPSQEGPNREQRRHPERMGGADDALTRDTQTQEDTVRDGPQDVQSVRAKSSGHGKKTADKWNQ